MKHLLRVTTLLLFWIISITTLQALFSQVYKVNPGPKGASFRGNNGMRIHDGIIHLVYEEQDGLPWQRSTVYARASLTDGEFTYLTIDSYESHLPIPTPVLEITPDGEIILLYLKTNHQYDEYFDLYRAVIDDQGTLIEQELLEENLISEVHFIRDGDNYHLIYRQAEEMPISRFTHFDDHFNSPLGDPTVKYIMYEGYDVIHGRYHSNTDIWIRQTGGPNQGFPLFTGPVTTGGIVRVYPGGGTNYPVDVVFPAGLTEYYPVIELPAGADAVRMNGMTPFGTQQHDNRIAFVTINGSHFESWIGNIVEGETVQIPVYDSYPPYGPVGSQTGTNTITIMDTIWAPGPSLTVNDQAVWVPYELWISGTVSGKQTWASSHDIYIKDDLLYTNTVPGEPPDGGDPDQPGFPQYLVNETDFLGLISERSIKIQYGYRHPADSIRYKPNTDGIYIYGSLAALAPESGSMIDFDAGVFTFQYQHPKGSTPAQIWQDQFYDNIDLHRFLYPGSLLDPWPPGLDYPWYNPLWPEPGYVFDHPMIPNPHNAPAVTYLRGELKLFGSIAQRRRGFLRRTGHPDLDTGHWDLENHIYGRHSSFPTGYDRAISNDLRLEEQSPPHFVTTPVEHLVYLRSDDGQSFNPVESVTGMPVSSLDQLLFTVEGDIIAFLTGDSEELLISADGGESFQEIFLDLPSGNGRVTDMLISGDILYLTTISEVIPGQDEYFHYECSLIDFSLELLTTSQSQFGPRSFVYTPHLDRVILSQPSQADLVNFYIVAPPMPVYQIYPLYEWSPGILPPASPDFLSSSLGMTSSGYDMAVALNLRADLYYDNKLYLAALQLPVPQELTAEIDDLSVLLSWEDPDFQDGRNSHRQKQAAARTEFPEYFYGYYLYRNYMQFAYLEPGENTYHDQDILPDTEYTYYLRGIYNFGESHSSNEETVMLVAAGEETVQPLITELTGNHPNPFNPETIISFSLSADTERLDLQIYNIRGQLVRRLIPSAPFPAGEHQVVWDGLDERGRPAGSGIFFYRMSTPDYTKIRKMLLLK